VEKQVKRILAYIKKYNIGYRYLSKEMGYTSVRISQVLTGKDKPSERFLILLYHALERYHSSLLRELRVLREKGD
jgi:transcriptional regulator with XRE-family HTH domain